MHISSVIVGVRPELLAAARDAIQQWPGVDVHAATPDSRLIVTVETDDDNASTETFARLAAVDGVMSVALVYHQFESDPDMEALHGSDPS